ncbi:MAG: dinitrogenase iron-molybdenum cofactor [archaeon]|nr:dinitrogenase iron-molybdenum cofactor [archaeon]
MKYAISTDNGQVSPHFGRCPSYTILKIENGIITEKEEIPNPGHSTGAIPAYLNNLNVNVIIAGGMGHRAVEFFNDYKIETVVGVSGTISNVINNIKNGTLKGGNSMCKPQGGHGYGIPKIDGHGI